MSLSSHAIRLQSVNLRYGDTPVIHDVSYEIPPKCLVTLAGPSGSGKSTLLRALCRMNDRLSGFTLTGKIEVMGQDIHHPSVNLNDLRRRVGLVFQKPCVFPKSIFQNTIFGLKYHRPKDKSLFPELAERAMVQAGLWNEVKDRLDDPATTLSQGQQQRLALARTLALEPDILLLDEPTASLDPKSTEVIEQLALALKKHQTLIWVTHDPKQAGRIADISLTIESGRLVPPS